MSHPTTDEVLRVARLARLAMTEQEARALTEHFANILTYMEKLNQLQTDNVEPATHAIAVTAPLRTDAVTNTPDLTLLQSAPLRDLTFFKVPKIIE